MNDLAEALAVIFNRTPVLGILILVLGILMTGVILVLVMILTGKIQFPEKKRKESDTPHEGCPFSADHILQANRSYERGKDIGVLPKHRIKLTMDEGDRILEIIWKMMTRVFYSRIAELQNTIDGSTKHPDSEYYTLLTWSGLNRECKMHFLNCVRENHFHSQDDSKFETYVNEQVAELLKTMTNFLDLYYRPNLISREALFELNKSIVSEIKIHLSQLFYRARSISVGVYNKACVILDSQGITDPEQREKELEWI